MKVFILTLFPEMFRCVLDASIMKRAVEKGLIQVELVNIRDYTFDQHHTVDDYPYGGGPGMVMKPEPVFLAMDAVERSIGKKPFTVFMSPQGEKFSTRLARDLARKDALAIVCGHYEGFDERVLTLADAEVSIGDYVLTGGELPAMVVLDAVSRFVPGVLGDEYSAESDSFSDGLLEGPQYTRPSEFKGMKVPQELITGDHASVQRWRRKESLRRTLLRRPDLLNKACLTFEDRLLLEEVQREESGQRSAKE